MLITKLAKNSGLSRISKKAERIIGISCAINIDTDMGKVKVCWRKTRKIRGGLHVFFTWIIVLNYDV